LRSLLGESGDDAQAAGVGHRRGQLGEADEVHATLDDRVLDAEQFGDACLHVRFRGSWIGGCSAARTRGPDAAAPAMVPRRGPAPAAPERGGQYRAGLGGGATAGRAAGAAPAVRFRGSETPRPARRPLSAPALPRPRPSRPSAPASARAPAPAAPS